MDNASTPKAAKKTVKRKKAAKVSTSEPQANTLDTKLDVSLELKSVLPDIESEPKPKKKNKKTKIKATESEPVEMITTQSSLVKGIEKLEKKIQKHVEKMDAPEPMLTDEQRFPILKDKELISRFMKVEMTNNQKGRIRQNLRESLIGTSKSLVPEIINNKIQSILKTSINLTDAELRRIRILFNLLKTSLKGADVTAADKIKQDQKDAQEGKKGKKKKEKGPKRYIVFLGNLPLDVTKEKIMDHFKEMSEHITDIRLPKKADLKRSAIAYLELTNEPSFEFALSKHHSMMGSKRINVLYSSPKESNMTKATAKSKTAKMVALNKSGKLVGSVPLARKRSQRRLKAKRMQAQAVASTA